ncbi:endonuclease/exonuclease/phosphatase family protein [Zunongwangia sp. F363]|uniref:Endonuclease/exonuclease/phosphatase family protein n=1 Tax=Autumnicola tepida TaxID=3075595 RepID=A0ABU3CDV3_9FLAO|nr:endonuclease/exonuclease/phosphatase family protein [Zunongwangia sp. F363]MDT0644524.1 endonuclease/exonuclease/phosphatase family protein [Zunongwangia sp. F363]
MRSLSFILILEVVFLVTSFSSYFPHATFQNSGESKQELLVMSYNIHHANPPSKPDSIDINAIVQTIMAQQPDLVALQEIDADTERSGKGNQAQIIAEKLGMHFFFGKAIDFESGGYGVAILSKYPLSEKTVRKLPSKPGTAGEARVLATAKVTLPNGKSLRFGSTHLDAQKENINRLLQIKKIAKISSEEKFPLIIAGDFNDTPDSEVIEILDNNFNRTCNNCKPTIPVNTPLHAIDFIAYKPQEDFSVTEHEVINETYASDHLPVVATIKLNF